jgi:membrane-associated protease RseP (regulator of RpoE activity)
MVHDAGRFVSPLESTGRRLAAIVLIAVFLATGGSGLRAQDAAAPPAAPAFEAGDISIGEPIALPFARPKSGTGSPAPAAASTESAAAATPGQGWLGITVAESKVPGRWMVDQVAPRSPAMAAGISPGDEVRAIGGLPLRNADDVAQALTSIAPGQDVRLAIGRGEEVSDITLTAVPRPAVVAKSLANSPAPDAAAASSQPDTDMTALATPQAAATPVPIGLAETPSQAAPLATLPLTPRDAPATAPPAALPPTPPAALAEAPPAAAVAAAPPITAAPAVTAAPVTSPRFPRPVESAEPPAARFGPSAARFEPPAARFEPPAARFEPAAAVAAAEPPTRVPQAAGNTGGRIALGVRTIPIDPGMQARFNLPAASGAYVIGVVGDLPASKAGVPPGSVIVALDERPVRSPDELTRLVTSGPVGTPVPLEYVLPGGTARRAEVVLQTLEQPLEEALVGSPTPAGVPTLQPQPEPTVARRAATSDEAAALRDEIRRLEARLQTIERRLTDR